MYYGRSTDLPGLLIARIEGFPLGAVLKRRIFDPLGTRDTSFLVPREKRNRRADAYGFDKDGRLTKRVTWGGGGSFRTARGYGLQIRRFRSLVHD